MKRKKVESKVEEKIITSMIMSKEFLGQIVPQLDLDLIKANHFKQIAKWCVRYYHKYQDAPRGQIETMYHSWVSKGKAKEETVEAVHDILEKMSDSYEENESINVPYLLDEASEHLSLLKFEQLRDNLDNALLENDHTIAQDTIDSFRAVALGKNKGIDVLRDKESLKNAFSASADPLFAVGSGDTQRFFEHSLARDNLIAVLAPEKRGKTFWCVEFTIRALMARRKVALFEVGDMSESQIIKRIGVRFTGRPMFKKDCGRIRVPTKIRKLRGEDVQLKYEHRTIEKPTTAKASYEAFQKFMRRFGISKDKTYLMTSCYSNSSINVAGITAQLDRWELENDFVPDVIIIDYADILASEPGIANYDTRDKVNETWKALRRLSQDKHCLVIAPTQADAASYGLETLTASNFSEDKRKLAHVTGMLGLNQTVDEKQMGVMRLNWIVLRESAFAIDRCLYVGQCLKIGRSYCCGYLR